MSAAVEIWLKVSQVKQITEHKLVVVVSPLSIESVAISELTHTI